MSATEAPRFTNRLVREKSPYLIQHAHNPVDWYPWGEEAFAAARRDNKPIFLSVGYSACHWCHVMERESFEDEAAARLLNEHFIPVKVDREERPDVDEIYMTAVQMLTQHGGWPMSVFLTPDGRPFYGGTYFPPEDRQGRPGFKTVLGQLAAAWNGRRDEVERVAADITQDLEQAARQRPVAGPAGPPDPAGLLRGAVAELRQRFDRKEGGFGGAPKFPPHHALALLLETVRRGTEDADPSPAGMLTRTLDKMALGGIYDHIGGGFHRYSTDAVWLLPHFEKMLYDNALLARVYADAFQVTGQAAYGRVARETCDWVLRDMTDAGGGFHAALDADSEGEEGKYYVWALAEVKEVLGDAPGAAFAARYDIRAGGNFRDEATGRPAGTNIPHLSGPELPAEIAPELAGARAKLLARRYGRVPPGKDDKVITSWNGLMIGGLAYAGKVLGEGRYVEAARRAAEFCLTTLRPDGKLLRRYREGEAALDAYLEDYAYLADGLLDLHEATGDARWADAARELADTLLADFWDAEEGGFFFTGRGHEALIARSKDLYDGALPSPNGVAARVLARLGALPGGGTYRARAREMLSAFHGVLHRVPHGTQTLVLAAVHTFEGGEEPSSVSGAAADVVTLAAEAPSPLPVAPGSATTARFLLTIAPGWHVNAHRVPEEYLIPTAATVTSDLPAAVGPVGYPAPVPWQSEGAALPTYQGAARFEVPLALAADAAPGRYSVTLGVRFQPCGEAECLPPDERSATLAVEVTGGGA